MIRYVIALALAVAFAAAVHADDGDEGYGGNTSARIVDKSRTYNQPKAYGGKGGKGGTGIGIGIGKGGDGGNARAYGGSAKAYGGKAYSGSSSSSKSGVYGSGNSRVKVDNDVEVDTSTATSTKTATRTSTNQGQKLVNNGPQVVVEDNSVSTYEASPNAPDVQVMSTSPCMVGVGGSFGNSVFSIGGSAGIKDEECTDMEVIRIGLSLGDLEIMDEAKALYLELVKARIMRRMEADTAPVTVVGGSDN